MSIFSRVKKAFTNNDINTESASQTSSKADAIEAFELQRHDFRDRQFRDKVEGVFDDIRHECFPKKVKAVFEDTSDQYVDQLTLKMISPQGLTVSVELRESELDRKSTRLNSSHVSISYAVFCLKKKKHYI